MANEEKVRVVVRVRPLLQRETVKGCKSCVQILEGQSQIVIGRDRRFTFDRILGPDTSQDSVFEHCVEPLVDGCFQGYNATVFAYGQTGSGKTFTIFGLDSVGCEDNDRQGIIPRALTKIFKKLNEMKDVQFSIHISYLEVYQEELHDLLHITTPAQDIHIRENESGNTIVMGIQAVPVQTVGDSISLLEQGSAARRTGTTKMNERSSRSHTVFTLHLDQRMSVCSTKPDDVEYISAKFHFVDLAGSERAHRTGNEGERFKESVFINTGLLALGNVISALGDPKRKASHVPYRDSKITRILKDSLGGNSKTVMLACLSPSEDSFAESLNSLKYANRARNIRNKPVMNKDPHAVQMEEMQCQIEALKGELHRVHTAATRSRHSTQTVNVEEHLQEMEEELTRSKQHCSNYRICVARAKQLVDDIVKKGQMSEEQIYQLKQWVELLSDVERGMSSDLESARLCDEDLSLIEHLQCELSRCKAELASDEDIFVDKVQELEELKQQLADKELMMERLTQHMGNLTGQCQELEHDIEIHRKDNEMQREQIISQQQLLQQQEQAMLLKERELLEQRETAQAISKQAQQTKQPVKVQVAAVQTSTSLDHINSLNQYQNGMTVQYRPWTAPHTMDLPEAVIQEFRAQSRLLLSRLEEQDQVQTPVFSDSDSDSDANKPSESKKLGQTVTVRRHQQLVAHRDIDSVSQPDAVDILNMSIVGSSLQMKETQHKYQEAVSKLKDLQLGIRLKEELIRELVQSSKQTDSINSQYSEKIKVMEKEITKTRAELEGMKKKLQDDSSSDSVSVQHLQSEYKQKVLNLQQKVEALQRRQKSSRQMSAIHQVSEKKLAALETNLGRMKNEQETLKRKLKITADEKSKIQHELQRYQQQVKSLEQKTEQQELVLKQKTHEVASASRRLRKQSQHQIDIRNKQEGIEIESRLAEKQQWLDSEVESLLQERTAVEVLQQDVARREQLIEEREAMLAEKSVLEMRMLRSSQIVSKQDVLRLSTHLQTVEASINSKQQELKEISDNPSKPESERIGQMKKALKSLQKEKERVIEASKQVESKLSDPQNEQRMMALEEAIEALDGMLDYQNQSISERESGMDQGTSGSLSEAPSDYITGQLEGLSGADAQQLLGSYFEKVVLLREEDRKKSTLCQELQLTVEEKEQIIIDLEIAVQETAANAERQITELEKESEQRVHVLMQQLSEATSIVPHSQETDIRIQQLEKDLYYYKTTSRELKRQLREASSSQDSQTEPARPVNGRSPTGKSSVRRTRKQLRQLSASEIAARSGGREQSSDQASDH